MAGPRVSIDLDRIERNAKTIVDRCRATGIEVFGVTKGTCGMPQVARAMLRGGVTGIGESRFENIRRLRASGIDCPMMLLRSPPLSRIEEVVASVDVSLNSELAVLRELSRVAERMSRIHDVILMVDLGDLREGIWPDELEPTIEEALTLKGIRIAGLGTNLTCFGAIIPTEKNLGELVGHAASLSSRFGLELKWISGGNSSSLPLLLAGRMPKGVNNLRIGEAILQGGRDTFLEQPWQALDREAFQLSGELLEVKVKPSMPIGTMGVDAFGNRPSFEDKGDRLRGILNIGREDVVVEGLVPINPGVTVLGASSDHLVLDLTDMIPEASVGDRLSFHMSYGAMLAAMTSEYVEKEPTLDKSQPDSGRRVRLFVEPDCAPIVAGEKLEKRLQRVASAVARASGLDSDMVARAIGSGERPLLLGADHSITEIGLKGAASATDAFGLLWFDATPSFAPPGKEASAAVNSILTRALGLDPAIKGMESRLSPENVVLIGLRDVTPEESGMIRQSRVSVLTIADIDALGIREAMRQALRIAQAGTRGLYVSYGHAVTDIQGGQAGSGGITLRETHQAMEIIAQTRDLLAMDVVGLSSSIEKRIAAEACNFILSAFGKQIL